MAWGWFESTQASEDSPFANEPLSGFERWKPHDDRTWQTMLLPGSSGVGIHVGQLLEPECCSGGYGGSTSMKTAYYGNTRGENAPILFPSFVEWNSVIDTTGQPYDSIKQVYGVEYPCVSIEAVQTSFSDFRWALDNLNYDFDAEMYSYDPNDRLLNWEGTKFHTMGLTPLWSVIPIPRQYAEQVRQSVIKIQYAGGLDIVSECWCTIDYMECSDECASQFDSKAECNCTIREKILEHIIQCYTNPPIFEHYMDSITQAYWAKALDRFYQGWQVVYDHAQLGETWASYSWQQQSPFLASPGQSPKDRPEWINSINSEMQQVS